MFSSRFKWNKVCYRSAHVNSSIAARYGKKNPLSWQLSVAIWWSGRLGSGILSQVNFLMEVDRSFPWENSRLGRYGTQHTWMNRRNASLITSDSFHQRPHSDREKRDACMFPHLYVPTSLCSHISMFPHLICSQSPWCDVRGWLGVKKQLSIYLVSPTACAGLA